MISKKLIKRVFSIAAAMLVCCSMIVPNVYADKKDKKDKEEKEEKVVDYADTIFDNTYVHTIDVTISDEDWADLLANPKQKTKYNVSVDIDGEHYDNVSMATKGNSSLSAVASSGSQRFSFKLNFGYYEKGQRYHGAKKLNLSNTYQDATYMKDYICYAIFRAAGVESPLTSYVQLSINGEVYGLYLAVEEIDGAYVDRAYEGDGEIYKPNNDPENGALGVDMDEIKDGFGESSGESSSDRSEDAADASVETPAATSETPDTISSATPEVEETPATESTDTATDETTAAKGDSSGAETPDAGEFAASNGDSAGERADGGEDGNNAGGFGGFGGFAMGGGAGRGGEDLAYTDDDLSSYSNIFDKAETKTTEEDHQRVVAALKNLSEGNIYDALDAEEVASYFAAHNFVLNYDSYTGTSLHNYYLYENDGLLSMLPWDYNQAFGSFMGAGGTGSGSTDMVNLGIDSPLSGTTEEARPMWAWIVSDEEYTNLYHEQMSKLLTNYFESGEFEAELTRVYELIRPYVESDPSAFFTVDEFDTAYETLLNFCLLRAESIRKQLDGTLATITSEQKEEDRVDGSAIDLSDTSGSAKMFPKGEDGEGFSFDDEFADSFGGSSGKKSSDENDENSESTENTEIESSDDANTEASN